MPTSAPTAPERRRLLSPGARKAWLLAHVVLSVGWLGAGAANAVLAVHSLLTPGGRRWHRYRRMPQSTPSICGP